MRDALDAARAALTLAPPNPRVGCVILSSDAQLLGQGHTQRTGGPHAEIMALRDAQARGNSVAGATAYVTLEPCSHQGRTGPCCDALIAAGIKKVVASLTDPNPKVGGQGFERLRAAGIEVDIGPGAAESRELNIGFFSRMVRGTPWVRMKVAASLDGQTALANGASQWITSAPARADGHAWRARACAVLTGIGTVLEDNPRLDVREVDTLRQPQLVVVDSRLETPLDAHLFIAGRAITIYAAVPNDAKKRPWRHAAPTSSTAPAVSPAPKARWTWPPCCATWPRARSTKSTWKPATSSTAPWCAKDWSTSFCSTWRPSCWVPGVAWSTSARWPSCRRRSRWNSAKPP